MFPTFLKPPRFVLFWEIRKYRMAGMIGMGVGCTNSIRSLLLEKVAKSGHVNSSEWKSRRMNYFVTLILVWGNLKKCMAGMLISLGSN